MTTRLRCEIFPADLNASVDFYVGVLGFAVMRDERDGPSPYLSLRRGEVELGAASRPAVAGHEHRRPPVGVELVLEVDDLDAELARVRARGWPLDAQLATRPWGLRDARLLDPDGYYWRLTDRPIAPVS
ncbi:MAG: VOC family protein [Actinomycetales bacterium]